MEALAPLPALLKTRSDAKTGHSFSRMRADRAPAGDAASPTRILVLSVSAGSGHVRAAQAIRAYADERGSAVTATHLDVMNFVPGAFRAVYTDFYIALVNKRPALWGYLYQLTNEAEPDGAMQKLRRAIERLNTRALRKEIEAFDPDAIICTHFLPAELLAPMVHSGDIACPVWVQVTDFDLHRMWVQDHMAGYFAGNEEVAYRLRARGIAGSSIHVTGIPIMPAFASPLRRQECARELGLAPHRTTLLVMGGGAGLGRIEEIAARLLLIQEDFQIIAMAGKNMTALAGLQILARRFPGRLLAQGFTSHVERLMACADFAITKPGGLTTSECLAMGVPMVINDAIPGQEERNAGYLLEQGVALQAFDAVTLEYRARHLLASPQKLLEMQRKAKAISLPHAARSVLDKVLETCRR